VANQLQQLLGERGKSAGTQVLPAPVASSTRDLVQGIRTGGHKAARPSAPVTSLVPARTRSSEVMAGVDVVTVEVKDPRMGQLIKVGVAALVLVLVVVVFRKMFRGVDSMVNGTIQSSDQLRAQLQAGAGPTPDVAVMDPGPGPSGSGGVPTGGSGEAQAAALYNAGARAEAAQDYQVALAQYSQVLNDFPKRPQAESAAFRIGKVRLELSQWSEGAMAFDEFMLRYPGSVNAPEALLRRGEANLQLGRTPEAAQDFTAVLERHPFSPLATEVYVRRGELRATQGDAQGARADFSLAKSRTSAADAWFQRAAKGLEALPATP